MLDLVTSPSLTVNREHSDILKLNLSNTYATVPDDIEGELAVLVHGLLSLDGCPAVGCVCRAGGKTGWAGMYPGIA